MALLGRETVKLVTLMQTCCSFIVEQLVIAAFVIYSAKYKLWHRGRVPEQVIQSEPQFTRGSEAIINSLPN